MAKALVIRKTDSLFDEVAGMQSRVRRWVNSKLGVSDWIPDAMGNVHFRGRLDIVPEIRQMIRRRHRVPETNRCPFCPVCCERSHSRIASASRSACSEYQHEMPFFWHIAEELV
jgi:hypothetical protein